MTLTLEIAPEIERALEEAARANGQSLPDFAAARLAEVAREAEREAAEDAADIAEADRIMEHSDPSKRRTLAELRAAIFGEAGDGHAGGTEATEATEAKAA